jgi:hypothetical protein
MRSRFVAFGQSPEPEEVAGLFEGGMIGEIVNINAAVRQYSLFAVDVADAGSGGNDAFQTFGCVGGGYAGHTPSQELRLVLPALSVPNRESQPIVIRQKRELSNRSLRRFAGLGVY